MEAQTYNLKGEATGKVEVPASVFGLVWKPVLIKQVLTAFLANQRKPWAHAKGRGEVRGGGRKPWRQKGTGRARHGSIRSPLWPGGGKSHGPSKDRDYSQKVNKKMVRAALLSALSKKFKDGEVKFVESMEMEPKTRVASVALRAMLAIPKNTKKMDALLVPSLEQKGVYRAAKNLTKAKAVNPGTLNIYDVLNYKHILIDKAAVGAIMKHYKAE